VFESQLHSPVVLRSGPGSMCVLVTRGCVTNFLKT
jgi:hypothetical protein